MEEQTLFKKIGTKQEVIISNDSIILKYGLNSMARIVSRNIYMESFFNGVVKFSNLKYFKVKKDSIVLVNFRFFSFNKYLINLTEEEINKIREILFSKGISEK